MLDATVMEEMQQIKRNLERAIQNEQPIEWKHNERWNKRLEKLPRSCALWQSYRQFDEVRTAAEAAEEKRRGWQAQIGQLSRRFAKFDPDAMSNEEFAAIEAGIRKYERALEMYKEQHAELKMRAEREHTRWAAEWEQYVQTLTEIDRLKQARLPRMVGLFDSRPDALRPHQERLERWEAARD